MVGNSGYRHTMTQYVAGPGNSTIYLDAYDIRDLAGNPLADLEPFPNEPYQVMWTAPERCGDAPPSQPN